MKVGKSCMCEKCIDATAKKYEVSIGVKEFIEFLVSNLKMNYMIAPNIPEARDKLKCIEAKLEAYEAVLAFIEFQENGIHIEEQENDM